MDKSARSANSLTPVMHIVDFCWSLGPQPRGSDKQYSVDTTIVLGIVCDLCIPAPNNFAGSGRQTQLRHIDFKDSTFAQNTELCVEGVLRVLLDGDDGQLHRHRKLRMGNL